MLPDRQRLVALKSWCNDVIFFLFDTVRVPVFCLSENRTENRFQTPVRSVNRVPVHETRDHIIIIRQNFTEVSMNKSKLFPVSLTWVVSACCVVGTWDHEGPGRYEDA